MTTWKWSGFSFLFLFGFGVGLAGASGSASYDLFLPQNSNYIDFPLSRFKSELGRAAAGLKDYVCDGTAEFQLFQNLAHPNPLADSLKLQNAANGPVFVYRHGTFYDVQGRAIRKPSGLFYGPLVEALAKIEAVPEGHELLELLETSPYPLTLTYGTWMTFDATRDGRRQSGLPLATALMFARERRISNEFPPIDQLGVGGRVVWDPDSRAERMEVGGEMKRAPNFVTLAHELFHAYDGIRGLLDRRIVFPPERFESTEVSEYRAMYFENRIRHNSGIPYAIHYGTYAENEPGVLDASGNPIWFPVPCLDRELVQ